MEYTAIPTKIWNDLKILIPQKIIESENIEIGEISFTDLSIEQQQKFLDSKKKPNSSFINI